jgi:hypothetical protein
MKPALADMFDELQRGHVYECRLRDKRWHLDGLQDGENVYIDPRPAILETLIHELMHRRFPRWGERKVTVEARKLLVSMSEAEKARWWRAYRKIRKIGRTVVEIAE